MEPFQRRISGLILEKLSPQIEAVLRAKVNTTTKTEHITSGFMCKQEEGNGRSWSTKLLGVGDAYFLQQNKVES